MKRILVGLVIGLLLLEAGRRLYRPADEAAAAGAAAYRAGDFATAEARFHEAERDSADKAPAAHNRAAALYRLSRFDDADHSYQRSAEGEALRAARADYDRGNCDFSEACKDENAADPELLRKAAQQYETCLAREGDVADAGSLFADARHNLELARLILSEFAEQEKKDGEEKKPESEVAKEDDPFADSNRAHPPDGQDGQQQAGGTKDGPKKDEQKPSETLAKNDVNKPQPRACKECERGGCPKCKKPGKGPGPNDSPRPNEGPKPIPGKADNGKAPGKGKSEQEVKNPDPGPGKKGKPGEGGKPNPNGKNGVGHTKEKGDGPVDESFKTKQQGGESEGKMVGPDGVIYERKEGQKKPDKPSKGGKDGGGDEAAEAMKEPKPDGKGGTPHGAPGDDGKPGVAKERNATGPKGLSAGPGHGGSGDVDADAEQSDGSGDPRERAAARRLRQAVQRIEKSREARPTPQGPAKGDEPNTDRKRDW